MKEVIVKHKLDLQLSPSQIHHYNTAERAIRSCRNNFIPGFSTTYTDFPVCEWDHPIPQSTNTINLLRNASFTPKLSDYVYICGKYHFIKNPMSSPGTTVFLHEKSTQNTSWDNSVSPGWYVDHIWIIIGL